MEKENWFNKSVEETVKKLNTNNTLGLTAEEVEKRKQKYGLNELEKGKKTPLIVKFLEQFKDFMIIVLIIAVLSEKNENEFNWKNRMHNRFNNHNGCCNC